MWKKLVSLNLALLMVFTLLTVPACAATPDGYAEFYRNRAEGDVVFKKSAVFLTSPAGLKLYDTGSSFSLPGKALVSYNSKPDGSGTEYPLSLLYKYAFSKDSAVPARLYAQWADAPDYHILYIGDGVGPSLEGKNYYLEAGRQLGTQVQLANADIFESAGDRRIIGWQTLGSSPQQYTPGQRIQVESNLVLIPILGSNYITYHYTGSSGSSVDKTVFYTWNDSYSTDPILVGDRGSNPITQDAYDSCRDLGRLFLGWQARGADTYYTGTVDDAPHDLYMAVPGTYPTGNYCVLHSAPGGFDDGALYTTYPLNKDGMVDDPDLLPVPAVDGYSFQGCWSRVLAGIEYDTGQVFSASWGRDRTGDDNKSCPVTFDPCNGTSVQCKNMVDAHITVFPDEPKMDGYTFEGWYYGKDGGWKVDEKHIWEHPMTVYAYWKEAPDAPVVSEDIKPEGAYTITFNRNWSTYYASTYTGANGVFLGTPWPDDPIPVAQWKEGTFLGWYTEPNTGGSASLGVEVTPDLPLALTGDTTLYAHWLLPGTSDPDPDVPKTGFVKFNLNYDSATNPPEPQEISVPGSLDSLPQDPIRESYDFLGWFTSRTGGLQVTTSTIFSGTTNVYARWQSNGGTTTPGGGGGDNPDDPKKEFTITVDANGGTLTSGAASLTTVGGKLTALPQASRPGYTLTGWFTEKDGGTQIVGATSFTADATIYAHWTANGTPPSGDTFTVSFNSQGGSAVSSQTVAGGAKASSPTAPTRSGYTFGGWYQEAACTNPWRFATDTVTENITLYAKWTAVPPPSTTTYTVTFDANGGTVSPSSSATGTGGTLGSLPTPTRAGYAFDGWYTAPSGGSRVSTSTVFNANTTVYAHWTQNSGSTPSTYYQIYTPGSVHGGSLSASHSSAVPGTVVTVSASPWSGYELNRFSAARVDTGETLVLTGLYRGQYTFVMPASDVRLSASYAAETAAQYPSGGIYSPPVPTRPVNWYFSGGRIYHVRDGLVPYASPLTRDMLVSVLYNMDPNSFGDPTAWAASHGIVPDIYASWLWGGDKAISREQTIAILFCYAQHMGYNTSQRASLAGYIDRGQIRAASQPAMSWARAVGLITGTSANTLSPQSLLTCEQANSILSRFTANVA